MDPRHEGGAAHRGGGHLQQRLLRPLPRLHQLGDRRHRRHRAHQKHRHRLRYFWAQKYLWRSEKYLLFYSSLHLRDDPGDAGQLARVAAGDDVRAADHAGRGGLHALVGPHHRHHQHERPHHQCRTLCGLLRTHRAWLPHRPRIQRFVLN